MKNPGMVVDHLNESPKKRLSKRKSELRSSVAFPSDTPPPNDHTSEMKAYVTKSHIVFRAFLAGGLLYCTREILGAAYPSGGSCKYDGKWDTGERPVIRPLLFRFIT